ncbi:SAFB-like transcription modulator [Anneissia japonica]|uniref:SAFB-like transcription modulator n=1 Tax=Anneissia japonica TaxID=1529436 RepID=UPI001425A936|nr:SAFB-like transcription modulator [Anneissia japonica]
MSVESTPGSEKKISELRVVDLRAELERRGLERSGVKAVLVERLHKAVEEEGADPNEILIVVANTPAKKTPAKKKEQEGDDTADNSYEMIDEMEEVMETEDSERQLEEHGMQIMEDIGPDYEMDNIEVLDEKMDSDINENDAILDVLESIGEDNDDALNVNAEYDQLLTEDEVDGDVPDRDKASNGQDKNTNATEGVNDTSLPPTPGSTVASDPLTKEDTIQMDTSAALKAEDNESLVVHVDEPALLELDADLTSTPKKPLDDSTAEEQTTARNADDRSGTPTKDEGTDKGVETDTTSTKTSEAKDGTKESGKDEKKDNKSTSKDATGDRKTGSGSATSGSRSKSSASTKTPSRDEKGRNLWVSNLSKNTRAADLKSAFSKYGKVIGAKVVTNARSPGAACYGFVTMSTSSEAAKAINHLHRTELHSKTIHVEWARNDPAPGSSRKPTTSTPRRDSRESSSRTSDTKKDPKSAEKSKVSEKPKAAEKKPTEKKPAEKSSKVAEKDKPASSSRDKTSSSAKDKASSSKEKSEAIKKEEKLGEKVEDKKADEKKEGVKPTSSPVKSGTAGKSDGKAIEEKKEGSSSKPSPGTRRDSSKDRISARSSSQNNADKKERDKRDSKDKKDVLSLDKIKEQRERERQRQREREMREKERRRMRDRENALRREREILRRQHREEEMKLQREREQLELERQRLEREKLERDRLERERLRLQQERLREEQRLEREREEQRRLEMQVRQEQERRANLKRTLDSRAPPIRETDPYWHDTKRSRPGTIEEFNRPDMNEPNLWNSSRVGDNSHIERRVERYDRRGNEQMRREDLQVTKFTGQQGVGRFREEQVRRDDTRREDNLNRDSRNRREEATRRNDPGRRDGNRRDDFRANEASRREDPSRRRETGPNRRDANATATRRSPRDERRVVAAGRERDSQRRQSGGVARDSRYPQDKSNSVSDHSESRNRQHDRQHDRGDRREPQRNAQDRDRSNTHHHANEHRRGGVASREESSGRPGTRNESSANARSDWKPDHRASGQVRESGGQRSDRRMAGSERHVELRGETERRDFNRDRNQQYSARMEYDRTTGRDERGGRDNQSSVHGIGLLGQGPRQQENNWSQSTLDNSLMNRPVERWPASGMVGGPMNQGSMSQVSQPMNQPMMNRSASGGYMGGAGGGPGMQQSSSMGSGMYNNMINTMPLAPGPGGSGGNFGMERSRPPQADVGFGGGQRGQRY